MKIEVKTTVTLDKETNEAMLLCLSTIEHMDSQCQCADCGGLDCDYCPWNELMGILRKSKTAIEDFRKRYVNI